MKLHLRRFQILHNAWNSNVSFMLATCRTTTVLPFSLLGHAWRSQVTQKELLETALQVKMNQEWVCSIHLYAEGGIAPPGVINLVWRSWPEGDSQTVTGSLKRNKTYSSFALRSQESTSCSYGSTCWRIFHRGKRRQKKEKKIDVLLSLPRRRAHFHAPNLQGSN